MIISPEITPGKSDKKKVTTNTMNTFNDCPGVGELQNYFQFNNINYTCIHDKIA